ncbi:MAG: hypothetical protein HKM23_04525 [Nitrosopumilus sp.]|nr:hypothetical protein [Nitrosopumilus sp.]
MIIVRNASAHERHTPRAVRQSRRGSGIRSSADSEILPYLALSKFV